MAIEDTDEKSLKQLKFVFLIDKSKSLLPFFSKVYTKALDQLDKGQAWLAHMMKILLGINPWNYVGFAVFPNIDNRESLEKTGLVKNDDKSKV